MYGEFSVIGSFDSKRVVFTTRFSVFFFFFDLIIFKKKLNIWLVEQCIYDLDFKNFQYIFVYCH